MIKVDEANPSAVPTAETGNVTLGAAPPFTPAPWEYRPLALGTGFAVVAKHKRPDAAPVASVNCASGNRFVSADFSDEELAANGRLIAAAPQLHEAARLTLKWLELSALYRDSNLSPIKELRAALGTVASSSDVFNNPDRDLDSQASSLKSSSSSTPRDTEEVAREVFEAGWNAGFQEALEPDRFPDQNRCEVHFIEWRDRTASPEKLKPNALCPYCFNDCYTEATNIEGKWIHFGTTDASENECLAALPDQVVAEEDQETGK